MEFNSPIELYNWMHKNISYKHTGKFLSVEEVMKKNMEIAMTRLILHAIILLKWV